MFVLNISRNHVYSNFFCNKNLKASPLLLKYSALKNKYKDCQSLTKILFDFSASSINAIKRCPRRSQLELAVQRMKMPLLEEMSSVSEHSVRINALPCISIATIGGVRRHRHARRSRTTRLTGFTRVIIIYPPPPRRATSGFFNMCWAIVRAWWLLGSVFTPADLDVTEENVST